jgi:excisionase family DNA binding protein
MSIRTAGGDGDVRREWHSVAAVARLLGVSVQTVRRYIHYGELPAIRLGLELRVSESDLMEWLQHRRINA